MTENNQKGNIEEQPHARAVSDEEYYGLGGIGEKSAAQGTAPSADVNSGAADAKMPGGEEAGASDTEPESSGQSDFTGAAEPVEPAEPSKPIESTELTEPGGSAGAAELTESAAPAESAGSTEPAESAVPVVLADTVGSDGKGESADENGSTGSIEPAGARKKKKGVLSDNAKLVIKDVAIACAIALLISVFVRPTVVQETSMQPTIQPNDYLLLSRMSYKFHDVERGDIIVFQSDLPLDETHNKLLIKRVIAIPGDTISIHDGAVYLNGERLEEDYIYEGGTPGEMAELTVPEGQVFVMGDHRANSVDSRVLGCIDQDTIIGKAVFRLYPFDTFGGLYD